MTTPSKVTLSENCFIGAALRPSNGVDSSIHINGYAIFFAGFGGLGGASMSYNFPPVFCKKNDVIELKGSGIVLKYKIRKIY